MKLSEMKLAKFTGAAILVMYKMRRKKRIENYCRRKTRIENYCCLFNKNRYLRSKCCVMWELTFVRKITNKWNVRKKTDSISLLYNTNDSAIYWEVTNLFTNDSAIYWEVTNLQYE